MRSITILIVALFTSVPLLANTAPDFDPASQKAKLACMLKKPFIFGASISAGYASISDATAAFAKLQTSRLLGTSSHYLGGNPDPITRLAKKYNTSPEITNISEIINQMEFSSIGPDQFRNYIQDPMNEANVRAASVIVSIDGMYWPTIYGDDCSWTEHAIAGTRGIIRFAVRNNIPILLGNVPNEDPKNVSLLLKGNSILPANWEAPKIQCLKMVESFLRQECKLEDQCYILDMKRIVDNLKGESGPFDREGITFQGKNYTHNEFRADGIHLWNEPKRTGRGTITPSIPHGMAYLMTYIEKSIAWNLPACK